MTGLTAVRPLSLPILICSILISLVPTLLYAIDLRLEGEQTSRYSRVYFNGNDTLNFQATARGTVISVVFNENITIVSNNINETLPDIVSRIRVVDNNQLIITLADSNFRIRNFIGNGKSGVDLFQTETPSGLQRISPTPVFKQTALSSLDENETNTNSSSPASEPPQEGVELIPEGVGRITKNHPIPVARSPRHIRMNERLKIQRKSDSQFSVLFQQKGDTNTLIFPWRKNVAAAVFVREDVLWIVFNDTADIDYYELEMMEAGSLKFLGQRPSSRVTIARLTGDSFNNLKVWKRGKSWYMSFGGELKGNIHDAVSQEEKIKRIIPIYSADNKKQIIINAGDYSVPAIQVTDPLILDNLRIIPINNLRYVPNTHRMVDLDLLATKQGIATINKTDNVRIKASHVLQQFFINSPTGHAHQNALENIRAEEETQIISERPRSMIDFTRLRFDDGQDFYQNIIEMQRAITFLSDDAKDQYMFELAKLYLANDLYQESTNVLEMVERNQPDFIKSPRFKFAKAVALYLNKEYPQGLNILNSIDLEDKSLSIQAKEEINFWKRASKWHISFIDSKNKDTAVPIAYNKYTDLFLSTYPPELLNHFAIESVKEYLDLDQNENASDILNMITVEEITNPEVRNELLYLLGRYFIQTGELERGMDFLKDVKADTFDRRNRAQAELLLTKTLYSMNEISIDETIDRLSQIRVIWRGDEIERNALKLLGRLYIQNEQYPEGLRAWRDILTYFPSDRDSLQIAKNMSKNFTDIYSTDKVEVMSEIDSLGVYYEFRELTPIGREGDTIVQRLAERLIKSDLLKRAASLLTHQVKFRLRGIEKSQVGARLAEVHLMNNSPRLALSAIQNSENPNLPLDLFIRRQLLSAEANIATRDYNKAINDLKNVPGDDAKMLRGHIYWLNEDWENVINTLAPLYKIEDNLIPLTDELSESLLKLAIAYTFDLNRQELNYLDDYFGHLLVDNGRNKEVLNFLVNNIAPISHVDFTNSVNLKKMREFLRYYSKSRF